MDLLDLMDLLEKRTLYEKRMKKVQDKDKVVFYDYLSYKRAAGWWTKLINDDWVRPYKIERAKYHAAFLHNLPNYYFLGFPIKELLKTCYSGGCCHTCVLALSLYFNNFEIITCNLVNYKAHYNQKSDKKIDEFEHSILLVNLGVQKIVIDTTWGMITDYNTYKYIFDIDKVRRISSKDLKNTEIYKFIEKNKYYVGPSFKSGLHEDELYREFSLMVNKYVDMCENYINSDNKHLEDFINRCLYKTTGIFEWRRSREFKSIVDYRIEYPSIDLFSLTDDEFDFTLESPYKITQEENSKTLKDYHKKKLLKKENIISKIYDIAWSWNE